MGGRLLTWRHVIVQKTQNPKRHYPLTIFVDIFSKTTLELGVTFHIYTIEVGFCPYLLYEKNVASTGFLVHIGIEPHSVDFSNTLSTSKSSI